ncbi:pyridoxal phosphate-dependent aminotransferase [Chromobacterium haemolyticum]|uniref:pyridoxal phosphate-dependent aminotransferase n=1 Tax=Chromobacterium haemolyticum TaxID=394935 RepID=UPI002379E54C|nr:pyridoxal phosphate-dependent aminotransferase [Chromobacterium haemolyticum]
MWVVADEVYAGLSFEAPHHSIAALPGMAERTLTLGSLSKSHAMAGWRLGWAAGPRPLIQHMGTLALCMLYGIPGFIQQAALLALQDYDAFVEPVRALYQRRRDLAHSLLSGVDGLQCPLPEAGMFLLLDVRGCGLEAGDFAWKLFEATGVSVLDAAAFGPTAAGFIRLGLVVDDERLAEACRRIARFAGQLRAAAPRQKESA